MSRPPHRPGHRCFVLMLVTFLITGCASAPPEPPTTVPSATATPEPTHTPMPELTTLARVVQAGTVKCGIPENRPGFGVLKNGIWQGMDVDYCKALAAAIFGDPMAYEVVPLSVNERFSALREGRVDVLFRFTSNTLFRDASGGEEVDFGPIYFYDNVTVMVKKDSGITDFNQLGGRTICVVEGTSAADALENQMQRNLLSVDNIVKLTGDTAHFDTYLAGQDCVAVAAESSQLGAYYDEAVDLLLPVSLSKEFIAPVVRQDDSQWRDVVAAVVNASIQAEEFTNINPAFDISSTGIAGNLLPIVTEDPEIQLFLGLAGDLGQSLGLPDTVNGRPIDPNAFARRVIEEVGNYEEIYRRNFTKADGTMFDVTELPAVRGPNKVWNEPAPNYGGLLVAPPIGVPVNN